MGLHYPACPTRASHTCTAGFSKMMQVRVLEDQEKGFLHKDTLIIEAHVFPQKPKTKLVADYVSSILLSRVMKISENLPRPTADNMNESK